MKQLITCMAVMLLSATLIGQENPVKWTFAGKKTGTDTWEIQLTAQISKGWHIYSQTTPEGGPVPTAVQFTPNPLVVANGAVKEVGKLEEHHEPLFGVKVKQYSDKVVLVQTVKVKANVKTAMSGTVEYMACNNVKCLPPRTENFSVPLK